MADPVIPDIYRAQVRVPGVSGLPEDVFVNTFAFRADLGVGGSAETMADEVKAMLEGFYGELTGVLSTAHADWQSAVIRTYDLGQPPPRIPVERPLELGIFSNSTSYPAEVAMCLSFYATVNTPRSRGRVFIGPLASSSGTFAEGDVRPTATAQGLLTAAAENLMGSTREGTWGIVSPSDGDFKVITAGWVDNAFDTQRRRGLAPSARVTWPAPA